MKRLDSDIFDVEELSSGNLYAYLERLGVPVPGRDLPSNQDEQSQADGHE